MDDTETVAAVPSGAGHPSANESPAPPAALRSPSPVSPPSPPPPASRPEAAELPLSELEFTGCKAVPMTWDQLRRYDGRLEVWDAGARTAWMVREPTSPAHENPSHGLAGLAALIAAVRGAPIKCFGSMDLMVRDEQGDPRRVMQADQTVYLYPQRVELLSAGAMVVGRHNYPDVVLEVDHTTDVRRGKLELYESWGFPELWVEVPEGYSASRPAGLRPGLTIHRLEGGAYRVSPESGAFPGWRAEAIHEAMNEAERSLRTDGILEELGRRLGARDGTGPDDDALMRSLRSRSRAEGERRGRAVTLGKFAHRMLRSRGVEVSERFFADPVFAASSEEAVFDAASACSSEAEFLAALRQRRIAADG